MRCCAAITSFCALTPSRLLSSFRNCSIPAIGRGNLVTILSHLGALSSSASIIRPSGLWCSSSNVSCNVSISPCCKCVGVGVAESCEPDGVGGGGGVAITPVAAGSGLSRCLLGLGCPYPCIFWSNPIAKRPAFLR